MLAELRTLISSPNKKHLAELAIAVYLAAANQAVPLNTSPPSAVCSAIVYNEEHMHHEQMTQHFNLQWLQEWKGRLEGKPNGVPSSNPNACLQMHRISRARCSNIIFIQDTNSNGLGCQTRSLVKETKPSKQANCQSSHLTVFNQQLVMPCKGSS